MGRLAKAKYIPPTTSNSMQDSQSCPSTNSNDSKREQYQHLIEPRLNLSSRNLAASLSSLNNDNRVQFHLSQTPPMSSGAPPCIQAQTLSPVLHSFTKDLLSLSNTGMPRSYDPSRSALLKKGAPRVSISVDDISAQTWNTTRNGNPAANSNAGGLLWPVPQFYLQPPSMGSSRAASPQPSIQHPPNPADGPDLRHRGELDMAEKYNYDLSKAQLKASSRTSALLAGFAMVALVELQYDEYTPRPLLILLGVITSLLVSVHLLALMMSTCILPYMEATGCTQDSPHLRLKFYIDLSWLFSTCIGLLLFLVEIGIIFFVKFDAVGYRTAGYITTAMLIPVVVIFIVFSYLIHKSRVSHSLGRFKHKVDTMKQFLDVEAQMPKTSMISPVKDI